MSVKVKIDGEVFELEEDYKKSIDYFSNAEAIDKMKSGEAVQHSVISLDRDRHHD